jgi:hypothetical protein
MLDGGQDAPLTPRGRTIFRLSLAGIIVLGLAAIVVARFA